MKNHLTILFASLCLLTVSLLAAPTGEIRQRMEQRLPQIDTLKASGVLGENNRGFIEIRNQGTPEATNIVSVENSDREAVYTEIAKQTGASSDAVGRARAKKIAENSHGGVWVQSENGTWAKK